MRNLFPSLSGCVGVLKSELTLAGSIELGVGHYYFFDSSHSVFLLEYLIHFHSGYFLVGKSLLLLLAILLIAFWSFWSTFYLALFLSGLMSWCALNPFYFGCVLPLKSFALWGLHRATSTGNTLFQADCTQVCTDSSSHILCEFISFFSKKSCFVHFLNCFILFQFHQFLLLYLWILLSFNPRAWDSLAKHTVTV